MNRAISLLCLFLSLTALGLSVAAYPASQRRGPSEEEIRKWVIKEMDAKDRSRIASLAPKVKSTYQEFLSPNQFDPAAFEPNSWEELLEPLFAIISSFGETK